MFFVKRFFCGLIAAGLWAQCALAALAITSPVAELTLQPGAKQKTFYTVQNNYKNDVEIAVSVKNFELGENKNLKAEDWLKLSKKSIKLKAGKSAKVKFTVRAPKNLQGSITGMVSFSVKTSGITVMSSKAVYLTASGTENIDFKFARVNAFNDTKNGGTGIAFVVENAGNTFVRPEAAAKLYKGGKYLTAHNMKAAMPVFPESKESFVIRFGRLADGVYNVDLFASSNDKTITETINFELKNGKVPTDVK
jgi:hypothetical protein